MVIEAIRNDGWSDSEIFAVELALVEAANNAIDHGNHFDPNKIATVSWKLVNGVLKVSIKDEGSGFRYEDVPDPRNGDYIDIPSGRGLLLIHGYMDDVFFNKTGNEITMIKKRATAS